MKIILLILLSTACLAQDLYIKVADIQTIRIPKGSVYYDTLPKGVGIVYRQLWTDHGLVDTTKQIVVKYETFQVDAVQKIDTIDSELLVYTDWTKHGPISDPVKVPGWYKNTISYSTTGEAEYTFNGTGVEIWAERLPSHGTGSVTVGTQVKTVSWAGPKQLPAKIAEFKGLAQGQHTLSMKPDSGVILIDFLVLVR